MKLVDQVRFLHTHKDTQTQDKHTHTRTILHKHTQQQDCTNTHKNRTAHIHTRTGLHKHTQEQNIVPHLLFIQKLSIKVQSLITWPQCNYSPELMLTPGLFWSFVLSTSVIIKHIITMNHHTQLYLYKVCMPIRVSLSEAYFCVWLLFDVFIVSCVLCLVWMQSYVSMWKAGIGCL